MNVRFVCVYSKWRIAPSSVVRIVDSVGTVGWIQTLQTSPICTFSSQNKTSIIFYLIYYIKRDTKKVILYTSWLKFLLLHELIFEH